MLKSNIGEIEWQNIFQQKLTVTDRGLSVAVSVSGAVHIQSLQSITRILNWHQTDL
jgi:hypothetical protein